MVLLELNDDESGVNSPISSTSCTKQPNFFMYFLRKKKGLLRSFWTIQCSLMKCLSMEEDYWVCSAARWC